jgi:hypothetical protein
MKKYLLSLTILLVLLCSCSLLSNKETEQLKKDNEQLKKDNEQLKKDISDLKSQNNNSNQTSRDNSNRYPIKKNQSENNMPNYQTQKNNTNSSSGNCTYWITSSSHKRHNSSCRWYKNSNGYCTDDPNEGVACKICGG